jgi:HD domain
MVILTDDETIDTILLACKNDLGGDYEKYRNHVYRVFNLTLWFCTADEKNRKALAIAAAFHDIGIWTANTFDYLAPSIELARSYLREQGLQHVEETVASIIANHHKFSSYKTNKMVEAFRKADLIDLSFNLFRFGISSELLHRLNKQFPAKGFHRFILAQAIKNTIRHPLNPLPMLKW